MHLSALTQLNGVSGNEDVVRKYIYDNIKTKCDKITIDSMGNMIAFKAGKKKNAKKMMLSSHMDEVGFIVSKITDDGFLKFKTVGGIDSRVLPAKFVTVGEKNKTGVIGSKAIHLMTMDERTSIIKTKDLYIDIGAKNKKDAEKTVSIGDYVSFMSNYTEFGNDMIKAKAIDDRAGCSILINMLDNRYDFDLYACFTVQEEVGLRGAKVCAYTVKPDIAIVIETTACSDTAGVEGFNYSTILGDGPAISLIDRRTYYDREFADYIYNIAKANNISAQYKKASFGGNDAGEIHISNSGVKTATISIPVRYIHTPSSVISKKDYNAANELLRVVLKEIDL
ncbi:MAG: M42 family metallopeptidase [Ruminococcaceae bacterium]|nr:M42 family metallopeptidase [Oscillospiraceae bacterium]